MTDNISLTDPESGLFIYSPENVIAQARAAKEHLGYKILTFFVDDEGNLAKAQTSTTATFYLSPSGGTLRDAELNIVLYSAKYDLYKGLGKIA
jgi:hypothetical protein